MPEKPSNTRQIFAVAFVMGAASLSMGILRPVLPLYLSDIGLGPSLLGLIVSVSMVGMVIGESLSGWLADRSGLRLPLLIATVVCGLVIVSFLISPAIPMLFLVGFFWGLCRPAFFGPGRGFLAEVAPTGKKSTYLAVTSAILALSRGVGALPGGFIADTLGYEWVFYVAGGVAVLGGLAIFIAPGGFGKVERRIETKPSGDRWTSYLPSFTLQCLIALFAFLNIGILLTFVPLLGTEVIGISATSVGAVFTVNGLATMAFSIPMGVLADRMGKRVGMVLGLLVSGGAMVGLAFTDTFGWLMVMGIVHAFGMAAFAPSALGLLSERVPAGRQATAMGLYGGVCENSGLVAGSALGGFAWEWLGPPATFYTGAVASGVGIVICLWLGKVKTGKSEEEYCH
jgi:MFS family permease